MKSIIAIENGGALMEQPARLITVFLLAVIVGVHINKIGSIPGAIGYTFGAILFPIIIGFALWGGFLFFYNLAKPDQSKRFNPFMAANIGLVFYLLAVFTK